MNLEQMLQDPVVKKKVYEKYPKEKKERDCATHKNQRDGLRWAHAKRLIEEGQKEKKEYGKIN